MTEPSPPNLAVNAVLTARLRGKNWTLAALWLVRRDLRRGRPVRWMTIVDVDQEWNEPIQLAYDNGSLLIAVNADDCVDAVLEKPKPDSF